MTNSNNNFSLRITYVQSSQGVTTATAQQGTQPQGPPYLPTPLAALGFTAIAPAGQALVQPIVGQPPLLAQAPPLSCQSQIPASQTAVAAGRQVNINNTSRGSCHIVEHYLINNNHVFLFRFSLPFTQLQLLPWQLVWSQCQLFPLRWQLRPRTWRPLPPLQPVAPTLVWERRWRWSRRASWTPSLRIKGHRAAPPSALCPRVQVTTVPSKLLCFIHIFLLWQWCKFKP